MILERFGVIDYGIFAGSLGVSLGIGLYFGCVRKTTTNNDLFKAERSMSTFPVLCSLFSSLISSIAVLGKSEP